MFAVRCELRCGAVRCSKFWLRCGAVRNFWKSLRCGAVRCAIFQNELRCGAVRCAIFKIHNFSKSFLSRKLCIFQLKIIKLCI